MDAGRFHILVIYTVITDERISHGDDLTLIGRIREDLLIAGHACIEYYLSKLFTRRTERITSKYLAVF